MATINRRLEVNAWRYFFVAALFCECAFGVSTAYSKETNEARYTLTSDMEKQLEILYSDYPLTFLHNCSISDIKNSKNIDCNLGSKNPHSTQRRFDWRPIFSLDHLDHFKRCAGKVCSDVKKRIMSDVHLWVPSLVVDPEMNTKKGVPMSAPITLDIDSTDINFKVTPNLPIDTKLGRIGRTLIYLQKEYGLELEESLSEKAFAWHLSYPPDEQEVSVNKWTRYLTGKGLLIANTSIERLHFELKERVVATDFKRWNNENLNAILTDYNDRIQADDLVGAYRLLLFKVNHYINISFDPFAFDIINGKQAVWQSLFDGLEMHHLVMQYSSLKFGDYEVFGKMMAFSVLAGEKQKAHDYARVFLNAYYREQEMEYIYDNHYPALMTALALLIVQEQWPTSLPDIVAKSPYKQLFDHATQGNAFKAALYDALNLYMDMGGSQLPYFKLTPYELMAINKIRAERFAEKEFPISHPLMSTPLTQVPKFTPSRSHPVIEQLQSTLLALKPIPPLMQRFFDGDKIGFTQLLKEGADPSELDYMGRSVIRLATESNRSEFIFELLAFKPNLSGVESLSLHHAISHKNSDLVKALVSAGAEINYEHQKLEKQRIHSLERASLTPDPQVLDFLLSRGAYLSDSKRLDGMIYNVYQNAEPQEIPVFHRVLLRHKVDLSRARPLCLPNVLHAGDSVLKHLIDSGIDIESRSYFAMTPLICAAYYGSYSAVDLLLKKGADITAKDEYGMTALAKAKDEEHLDIVNLLQGYMQSNH